MLTPNIEEIRPRAMLLRQLRQFFDARAFLEVQPPCLSRDCIIDAFIDPIEVKSDQFGLGINLPSRYFLQTSPEACMKRMLAAGAPSIYSIGPVFRSGELGDLHNVEFTMLEWYDVGARLPQGIELLGELASEVLEAAGYEVSDYRQLFLNSLDLDPIEASIESLRAHCDRIDRSLTTSIGHDRDQLLDALMSHFIQPSLGQACPLIVKNYPLSQAALARVVDDDPQCAARFELFFGGVELANGYDELLDADQLVERFRKSNARRQQAGRPTLPVNLAIVDAMRAGLPPCTGVAVGVDRLLMAQLRLGSLAGVMPFSIETA